MRLTLSSDFKCLLVGFCSVLVFTEASQATKYSQYIGPRKNYLCEVEDSGELVFYKERGSSDDFIERSLSSEKRTIERSRDSLEKAIASAKRRYGSNSSRVRSLKSQFSEAKALITAFNKCAARGSSSGGGSGGGGGGSSPSTPTEEAACTVIQGARAMTVSTRIAKGTRCTASTSPVVFIELFDGRGEDLGSCTGTVIDAHTVLSAGHCLEDGASAADVTVGGQTIRASRLILNPLYNPDADDFQYHDLSLLKFSAALPVAPVQLMTSDAPVKGDTAVIAGYGGDESDTYGVLKAAKVPLSNVAADGIQTKFKANGTTGNTCSGDSGGPLLVKRGGTWLIAGVTSNGEADKCGADDTSFYANVTISDNMSFILGNLG